MNVLDIYRRPANLKDWDSINELSALEAAYLWQGFEPQESMKSTTPPIVKARAEQLAQQLGLAEDPWAMPGFSPVPRKVSRAELIKLAQLTGERPAFLFPDARPRSRTLVVPPDEFEVLPAGSADSEAAAKRIAELEGELADLKRDRDQWKQKAADMVAQPQADEELNPKERNTLLRLVAVMAVQGYGFSPGAARLDGIGDLMTDAEKVGLPFDDNTLRKWLREAFLQLPGKPRQT